MKTSRILLIGGARSGKSALAARWSAERAGAVCNVVTGCESDPEMVARIAAHRRERPRHWRVREEPVHLARALREEQDSLLLIDCLTLWISNCLWPATGQTHEFSSSQPAGGADINGWRRERDDFLDALRAVSTDVIIVSNEVGTGIVPENAASRVFRDEQGWLNQAVAVVCEEVYFVTAGLPLCLKSCQSAQGHTAAPLP